MAVPKRKTSRSNTRSRRSMWKATAPTLAPVCTDDCAGLCVDCGQRLDDLPADHHHEIVDARWAGLAEKFGTSATSSPGAPGESPTTEEN